MADFDAAPPLDTSRPPGVRAFRAPHAPASSFEVSREALAAKAFSADSVFGAAGANPRDEAPACRVGDAAERRLAARLAKDSGPPVRPPVPAARPALPTSFRRPVSADALDTVHNLDDMLMAALAASRPWCVDLAIGVAASLELRMDLMDVVLELSRTWLAGDRLGERFYVAGASVPSSATSLAERTECDATALKRQTHGASARSPGGAGGALVGAARVAAAAQAVQDTLVLEPAWARFVDAEDAFRVRWLDWSPPSLAVFLSLGTSSRRMVVGDRDALASPDARGQRRPTSLGAGSFGAGSFADFLLDDGSLMPCDDISLAPRVFLDTVAVTQSTQDETQEEAAATATAAAVHTPVAPPSDARRAAAAEARRAGPGGASRTARAAAAAASICVLDKPAFCKILPRYFKLSYKTGAAAADLKKITNFSDSIQPRIMKSAQLV
ncbi:hypothetical protein JL721_6272 [Aureococcus anophagefferens]|nr:hypothetical protein JL721_6272 [Aureococcus anophagefferens]